MIVNVAGCGAMLKDYGHHWHDAQQKDRETFAAKVQDIHQFLDQLGIVPPTGRIDLVGDVSRRLPSGSCAKNSPSAPPSFGTDSWAGDEGIARNGNLLRRRGHVQPHRAGNVGPAQSPQAGEHFEHRRRAVLTANAGCLLQIDREARRQHERLWIAHPIDVLDMSYRGVSPPV